MFKVFTNHRKSTKFEINIKENRRVNQEWTIQRHWQHWAHKMKTNKSKSLFIVVFVLVL